MEQIPILLLKSNKGRMMKMITKELLKKLRVDMDKALSIESI